MCLLFVATNAKKIKEKDIEDIGNILLESQRDGFGFAAMGKKGVFGQKFIGHNYTYSKEDIELPITEPIREVFGEAGAITGAAIFHGRTCTNSRGLVNTHPMQRDGWSLIHNGVVTNHGPSYKKFTSNDSEDVLYTYLNGGIDNVAKNLTGYYAFAALSPEGKLVVARDNMASLYITYSPTLESYLIGTTVNLIVEICRKIKAKHRNFYTFKAETYTEFDGNILKKWNEFNSRGYEWRESQFSHLSLGRALDNVQSRDSGTGNVIDVSAFRANNGDGKIIYPYDENDGEFEPDDEDFAKEAYDKYLDEIYNMDVAYKIYNKHDEEITPHEFLKLDFSLQSECEIVRPDGTILEPFEGEPRLSTRHHRRS